VTGNAALCGAWSPVTTRSTAGTWTSSGRWSTCSAAHGPVASDLRLLTAILHVNLHLERIGDMAVNVARLGQVVVGAPRSRRWTRHLEQMSENAVWMVELAMQAFGARDAPGSQQLPTLDAQVDELNRFVLAPGQPLDQLAWVVHLHDAGRQLERAADHAVDIAEQICFLVTGELTEFDSTPRVPALTSECLGRTTGRPHDPPGTGPSAVGAPQALVDAPPKAGAPAPPSKERTDGHLSTLRKRRRISRR
jgi:hypothetical protein